MGTVLLSSLHCSILPSNYAWAKRSPLLTIYARGPAKQSIIGFIIFGFAYLMQFHFINKVLFPKRNIDPGGGKTRRKKYSFSLCLNIYLIMR